MSPNQAHSQQQRRPWRAAQQPAGSLSARPLFGSNSTAHKPQRVGSIERRNSGGTLTRTEPGTPRRAKSDMLDKAPRVVDFTGQAHTLTHTPAHTSAHTCRHWQQHRGTPRATHRAERSEAQAGTHHQAGPDARQGAHGRICKQARRQAGRHARTSRRRHTAKQAPTCTAYQAGADAQGQAYQAGAALDSRPSGPSTAERSEAGAGGHFPDEGGLAM